MFFFWTRSSHRPRHLPLHASLLVYTRTHGIQPQSLFFVSLVRQSVMQTDGFETEILLVATRLFQGRVYCSCAQNIARVFSAAIFWVVAADLCAPCTMQVQNCDKNRKRFLHHGQGHRVVVDVFAGMFLFETSLISSVFACDSNMVIWIGCIIVR